MRESVKRGISFGLTSGIITTLGLMMGLNAGTGLKLAVIGGVLTIAIADAFSDSLGIHIAEESSKRNGHRAIWEATISTFFTKFFVAASFIVALLVFELSLAIKINLLWGFILLVVFNFILARRRNENPWIVVSEHVLIAAVVVTITFFIGKGIALYFG
jgi:vacuolar iron transporter family protein